MVFQHRSVGKRPIAKGADKGGRRLWYTVSGHVFVGRFLGIETSKTNVTFPYPFRVMCLLKVSIQIGLVVKLRITLPALNVFYMVFGFMLVQSGTAGKYRFADRARVYSRRGRAGGPVCIFGVSSCDMFEHVRQGAAKLLAVRTVCLFGSSRAVYLVPFSFEFRTFDLTAVWTHVSARGVEVRHVPGKGFVIKGYPGTEQTGKPVVLTSSCTFAFPCADQRSFAAPAYLGITPCDT
jgi:hypothetical protein